MKNPHGSFLTSRRRWNKVANKSKKSKSQVKREKFNYRNAYLKKNPGLFGCVWICSICHLPVIGKSNLAIDHIWPLARGGPNRLFNTAAAHKSCNSKKRAKMGLYVPNGYIGKVVETAIFRSRDIIKFLIGAPLLLGVILIVFIIFGG